MTAGPGARAPNYIRDIAPYQGGRPISEIAREYGFAESQVVKLASNENPLGPSPLGVAAATRALAQSELYPDGGCFALRQKLAAKHGLAPRAVGLHVRDAILNDRFYVFTLPESSAPANRAVIEGRAKELLEALEAGIVQT